MQRVHVSPRVGGLAVDDLTTAHVEVLATAMLADGLSPKTIRNVLSFLHRSSSTRSIAAGCARTLFAALRALVVGVGET
jgi:hypothetical protein